MIAAKKQGKVRRDGTWNWISGEWVFILYADPKQDEQ